MIKEYENGDALVEENRAVLDTNQYLSQYFIVDAPMVTEPDKNNYALRSQTEDGRTLLAMKPEPFGLLLFGAPENVPELLSHMADRGFEFDRFLCGSDVGEAVSAFMKVKYGVSFDETLAMDFMEALEVTEPSSPDVVVATPEDLDELVECDRQFIKDCGLVDTVDPEKTLKYIDSFRLIKENGRIISMARLTPSPGNAMKISYVYTVDEYRGKGYARKVVNYVKNEAILQGLAATLNVDKKNPVSNHLYSSLGFRRVFSQSEYRKRK